MKNTKTIEHGDRVNFDFEGFIHGKAFLGGSAKGFTLVIGSGQFIPGFEDQMIGMEVGTTKDLELQFPFDYHAEHLAGEEVTFKVKVNSIKKGN